MQRLADVLERRFALTATRPGESQSQTFVSLETSLRVARNLAMQGYVVSVRGLTEEDDVGEILVTCGHTA